MRRRDARIAKSRLYRTGGLAFLVGVVVAGAALMWTATRVNPRLSGDLCPAPEAISGETILIVDATDSWSELRKRAVAREISAITTSVPRFTRISLYVVRKDDAHPTSELTLCNPGSPEQIADDARDIKLPPELISNPERAAERFETAFRSRVDSLVSNIGQAAPQERSPIIETVRFAALGRGDGLPLTLYLISDLYQNSDLCSFYNAPSCIQMIERIADPSVGGVHDLSGADVQILLLSPRSGGPIGTDDLMQFWYEYFGGQGAIIDRVKRIEQ